MPADEKYQRRIRKRIGMVFQQFNLFPNMRVRQNITEGPIHSLGLPRAEAEERADKLLDMVGIADKADAQPKQKWVQHPLKWGAAAKRERTPSHASSSSPTPPPGWCRWPAARSSSRRDATCCAR